MQRNRKARPAVSICELALTPRFDLAQTFDDDFV